LGISRSQLYVLGAQGDIEFVHIGRLARVPRQSLTDYVQRLRTESRGMFASGDAVGPGI
jgi:excisionase family DNA binding protein